MKIEALENNKQLAAVVELETACFGNEAWRESAITPVLTSSVRQGYVLFDKDRPVAYVLLQCIAGEGEIERLGVHPHDRRKGLAQRLLNEVFDYCALECCFLDVSACNEAAWRLYQKLGFESLGRRRAYYHDGTDAIIMRWKRNENE